MNKELSKVSKYGARYDSMPRVLRLFYPLYRKLVPEYFICLLKSELTSCNSVLDLGCGYNSPIQHCNVPFSVGIELFDLYLQESKRRAIHDGYIKADIMKVKLKPKCFDAVVAIEVLEHLTKEEGHTLIERMEMWARKKVVVTTPNGYLPQDGYDNNPLQEHKSGWNTEELQELGFKVFGTGGWKKLRRWGRDMKYIEPIYLWAAISDLTARIASNYPRLASQLLATKEMEKRHNNDNTKEGE